MGGGGSSAPNVIQQSGAKDQLDKNAMLSSDPRVASLLQQYASGGISLQDAMAQGKSMFNPQSKDDWVKANKSQIDAGMNDPGKRFEYAQTDEGKKAAAGGDDSFNKAFAGYQSTQDQGALDKGYQDYLSKNPYAGADENLMGLLATSPMAAERYSNDQLQQSDLTKGLFGQGGLQDLVQGNVKKYSDIGDQDRSEYNDLLKQMADQKSYQLTPEDQTAFGQVAGDITRQSGEQEAQASQALANRGLAQGPSGAAGVLFSGIQGNKFEQLAKAQTDIANQRYQRALDTFNLRNQATSQRNAIDAGMYNSNLGGAESLGNLAQAAKSGIFNRANAGVENNYNHLIQASNQDLNQNQLLQNSANTQWQQQQASAGPNLGTVLGGLGTGVVGAATGGFGGAAGTTLANGLFGNGGGNIYYSSPTGSQALTAPAVGSSYGKG